MKTKITYELLMASGVLAGIKFSFLPSVNLLAWVFIAMVLDLITGVAKATVLKEARTSSGYRKTVIKFTQYAGAILAGIILGNVLPQEIELVRYVTDGLLILLVYIETTSIFENLYAIDSNSPFSKYFISPVLRLLTLAIRKTPLAQNAAENEK